MLTSVLLQNPVQAMWGGKKHAVKFAFIFSMLLLKNVPNNENNILIPIPKMHKRTDNFIVERLIHNGEDTHRQWDSTGKSLYFLKCAFI